jgi:hypothetical protein
MAGGRKSAKDDKNRVKRLGYRCFGLFLLFQKEKSWLWTRKRERTGMWYIRGRGRKRK